MTVYARMRAASVQPYYTLVYASIPSYPTPLVATLKITNSLRNLVLIAKYTQNNIAYRHIFEAPIESFLKLAFPEGRHKHRLTKMAKV